MAYIEDDLMRLKKHVVLLEDALLNAFSALRVLASERHDAHGHYDPEEDCADPVCIAARNDGRMSEES